MLGEQELQDEYGLSSENLKWVKSTFMKVLRHFLNKSQIGIELKIEKLSFQTEIQAKLERLWEKACLELITHPREYCLMDTAPSDSYVRNFAWGLDAIIKARLEMNFRLERISTKTQTPPQTHSTQDSAHTQ